jgi:hypothetical protein
MAGPSQGGEHLQVLTSFAPRAARSLWVGSLAFAVGLVITTFVVLSTHRLYRSEALLAYQRGIRAASMNEEGEPAKLVGARLRDTMLSRQRLEGFIKSMNLYTKLVDKRGMVEAVDLMLKHLVVKDREGYTYAVSFDYESRDLAQSVLQKILDEIIRDERQRRAKEAEDTKRFLDAERKQADEDLKEKEGALSAFLTAHPQLAGEAAGGSASAGSLLRAADRERVGLPGTDTTALEIQAAQIEESLAAAGARPAPTRSGEVGLDPALVASRTRAEADVQAAQKDLADKQAHLTNEHPDVKQALRRLALAEAAQRRVDAAIAAWKPPASSAAPNPAAEAPAGEDGRVAALRRALTAVRQQIAVVKSRGMPRAEVPKTVSSVVAIETEWTRRNREVSEARERQSQLESKQFQAEIALTLADAGRAGQFVIADPPFRPMRPVAGSRFKVAAGGFAGSLFLALLTIGLAAAVDDRLYALRDVESLLDDGIVVAIPNGIRRLPTKPAAGKERPSAASQEDDKGSANKSAG